MFFWKRNQAFVLTFVILFPTPNALFGGQKTDEKVSFNRDIRPILSNLCFQCHGPDANNRKADLRFDTEEGSQVDLGGYVAIVPGHPEKSEMYRRITSDIKAIRMPPAKTKHELTAAQIDLIRRWIKQGAKWEKHWSLIPPIRSTLPSVKVVDWPNNPIDYFILSRLERDGLKPSPQASNITLIRRVTLDLTGLPPTPEEVDAFLGDSSPNAYEKVVDRLLASPRYGERMALPWLDAARYADTNGYQTDGPRIMWRWRDWVIDAYNKNMPFDQFTVEQIAGDMLPNATLQQKIATGFNRNHRGNAEGGVIPEEYAVEYVVDRVDTTSTVWLALTVGCGKCHDHKYDPITQKEFYQFFAFFNNIPEKGKAVKYGNSPPVIKSPTRFQQQQWQALQKKIARAEKEFQRLQPALKTAQRTWEQTLDPSVKIPWAPAKDMTTRFDLDDGKQPGKFDNATAFDGATSVNKGDVGDFGFFDKLSFSIWVKPQADHGIILSRMTDTDRREGYSVEWHDGRLHVNLSKRWLDDAIRIRTEKPLPLNQWYHVVVTYDGTRMADGVRVYVNGIRQEQETLLDQLNQSFEVNEAFRLGSTASKRDRFVGLLDEVRIYARAITEDEVQILGTPEWINQIAAIPAKQRSPGQKLKIRAYYLQHHAPKNIQRSHRRLLGLLEDRQMLDESIPTTMVMQERKKRRPTHILIRGEYDKKGERVKPGIPESLPPLPKNAPNNRLGFAKWLVHPSNPLTARVAVNRYWQLFFGAGLVESTEDFGSQGAWPTHPDLLDWLAVEFMESGWNIKAMHKLIVTSAAYRQSSRINSALQKHDPDNRLLARGPRVRMSAHAIRDQALFVSGLYVEHIGGPSVKPYQPPGLWEELGGGIYKRDKGDKLYRRSLYTFWKRAVQPPAMMTFDAAGRESCVVRTMRTNTPLQALNLMNDVTYVEAARVLAQRVMLQKSNTKDRLQRMFRLATARYPTPIESEVLLNGWRRHHEHFRNNAKAAERLLTQGEFPRSTEFECEELAAYTLVAGVILNLDEMITKE